ncbi:AraC family transcriptional regulator [Paenibacillus harenae]|uniref:AraC-like DNA-binding protein n=1 Tax=Paenibacillus harenae TaxID=306543 RepID=A0ABT9TZ51_PAEHA|nr:AraC family transcriptional regulator [Paenibacillus harenae]MDQ0112650.1 AraC-like DNA-binding protein [Paenibacillus harenae]
MTIQSSGLFPNLLHHFFWNHKEKFLYGVDTYEHWVLFAVEGGSFRYRIGDSEGIAQMGDVIVCPPSTPFHRDVVNPPSFHFIGFSFDALSEDPAVSEEEELAVNHRLATSAYKPAIGHRERLADNLRFFKQQAHAPAEMDRKFYWHNHALNDIWLFCLQTIATGDHQVELQPSDPLIEQAKLYIQRNGFGDMSMLRLADELGISPVQLTRRFTRSAGMTPSRYLNHIRLEHAKSLLVDTQLNLEQIALACGFNNGFYLSRVFTKLLKISPSAYRKANGV